jgi:hypothetical protein
LSLTSIVELLALCCMARPTIWTGPQAVKL